MARCPCCAKQLSLVIDDAPFCWTCGLYASDPAGECDSPSHRLTPSADMPACRDEDPATPAVLAACYPDPPEYQHPED